MAKNMQEWWCVTWVSGHKTGLWSDFRLVGGHPSKNCLLWVILYFHNCEGIDRVGTIWVYPVLIRSKDKLVIRLLSVLFDPVFRQMMDLNSSHPRCFSDPPKLSTAVTVADLNLLSSEFRLASKRSPFVSSEVLIITLRMWFCKIFLGAVAKKQIWFSERVWESVQEFAFYNLTFY